jgi:pyruvate-ferredoxin/flavodoxin oxidoreductase
MEGMGPLQDCAPHANSMNTARVTIDGNEAAAYVAHKTNEVIAIYPITPFSTITRASFVACHQFSFLSDLNVLKDADEGATFLLNSPYTGTIGAELSSALLAADQSNEAGIQAQRERVVQLREILRQSPENIDAVELLQFADSLVRRDVWIVGGDGWAYDIGYGGLDHVLASGQNVNILVLDSEVYSNTGGQTSKSTPRAAVARFSAGGKSTPKKDLALMAMVYGNVYVARVAMGAGDMQTLKAFNEAESFDGPSLIIAYAPCIAHGIDMHLGLHQQKLAVQSGHWPLFRFDPRRAAEGKNPMQLDSKAPSIPLEDYLYNETRYTTLRQAHPEEARRLLEEAKQDVTDRWKMYETWANMDGGSAQTPK